MICLRVFLNIESQNKIKPNDYAAVTELASSPSPSSCTAISAESASDLLLVNLSYATQTHSHTKRY